MNSIAERGRRFTSLQCLLFASLSIMLASCDSKESVHDWGFVTASNGLVYRINKKTGEVSLITVEQVTKLDEARERKKDITKKIYVKDWPVQKVKILGDLSLHLKTTWRDGKLQYIFSASPYSSQVQKERERQFSDARFTVNLYDVDGFELFSLPVKISDMTAVVDDTGKTTSIQANGSTVCSVDTYEALGVSTIGWGGFQKDSP